MKGNYLECFVVGMAASLFYVWALESGRIAASARQQLGALLCLLALVGLLSCLLWAIHVNRIAPEAFTSQWWLFPESPSWYIAGDWMLTLCFASLLLGVLLRSGKVQQFFSWSPLRYLGKISYSVYLWHWTILLVLITTFTSYLQYVLVSLGIIVVFCSLSYYLIERPFLRLRAPRPHVVTKPT